MDLELAGKAAVITGSTRGIGKHIAIALAKEGCNVALSGRTRETLVATAQEIRDLGTKTVEIEGDLTQPGAPEQLLQAAAQAFGRVDVLVNCVGGGRGTTFVETSDA